MTELYIHQTVRMHHKPSFEQYNTLGGGGYINYTNEFVPAEFICNADDSATLLAFIDELRILPGLQVDREHHQSEITVKIHSKETLLIFWLRWM